jgi:hypothetical protein
MCRATLPLFEMQALGDPRPREALDGVRAFARGELRIGPVRALAASAHAAARDVADWAAGDDSAAPADVVEWADAHASLAVRGVLRRLPSRTHAPGPLGALLLELPRRLTDGE